VIECVPELAQKDENNSNDIFDCKFPSFTSHFRHPIILLLPANLPFRTPSNWNTKPTRITRIGTLCPRDTAIVARKM